ncbi:Ldh family oxidoreductase [Aromatoleum toluvorans]|uniref:Ldh family oxidoreductase n=1 Tax=Aromatoleum toluvorans TaxID=92002 RepID=A0ABX1Q5H9_9RHOO|nr:Ldh family oxidoreductase [Aromatoleum toluvorans]NMG46140.1 Ldh family oxidoreductase [Aromatoleum toluvorans]
MPNTVNISIETALDLCKRAALAQGASEYVAASLAAATVAAEARGQASVGIRHFLDYLDAMADGRLDGAARPSLSRPAPAVIASDAHRGIAHLGFDLAFEDLVTTAKSFGLSLFTQRNAYTCGALGYFAERLAQKGLVALAAGNANALLAAGGSRKPVYGTNPLAFAAPQQDGPPLLVDQASSATAFVNIRAAAAAGKPLPAGWALDEAGEPTTDATAALTGALLAFGGNRGGNIALMVEILATMSGGNWSLDAPSFLEGTQSPAVGMLVVAINPTVLDADFTSRLSAQLDRLHRDYKVFVPGYEKAEALRASSTNGMAVDEELIRKLQGY